VDALAILQLAQQAIGMVATIRGLVAKGHVVRPDGSVVTLEELDAAITAAQQAVVSAGDAARARIESRT